MNQEHLQQLKKFEQKVMACTDDLKNHIINSEKETEIVKDNVKLLKNVVFGNKEIGEMGIKEKVDDIHNILIQAKGIKGFFGLIILIGILIITLKGWFIR